MKNQYQYLLYIIIVILLCVSIGQAQGIYKKEVVFNKNEISIQTNLDIRERPTLGLVLSGGGARGLVHLGVLMALEENDIPIDLIVGTSIGSVIGGLYASGYSCDDIKKILKSIKWEDIYRDSAQRTTLFPSQKDKRDRYLISIRFNGIEPYIPPSYSPGQRVLAFLSQQFLKAPYQVYNNFNDLKIPFRAVATDLVSGKQVVLKDGNLAEAINASLAVPLLFSPIEKDSMLLVDGGLISNLPVQVALDEGIKHVVAVDATSRLRKKDDVLIPWKLVDQATTIMSAVSTKLDRQKADIVIEPKLEEFPNDQFQDIDKLIETGKKYTENKIKNIQALIKASYPDSGKIFRADSIAVIVNDQQVSLSDFRDLVTFSRSEITKNSILSRIDSLLAYGHYKSVQAETGINDSVKYISFRLYEFPKIEDISIIGNRSFSDEHLKKIMTSQPGNKLNYIQLNNDLDKIIMYYRKNGYSLADITKLTWNEYTDSLSITIDEGVINDIEVIGNELTQHFVIEREFKYQKGHVFNWMPVQRAIQNVYATNLFERVNVEFAKMDSSYKMMIKVQEKSPIVARLGGKYDSDRRMQAYLELSHENIWGTGMQVDFLSRLGMRDGNIGLSIIEDRIFLSNFNFGIKTYHTWEINPVAMPGEPSGRYREERTGLRIQLGRQVRRLGQLVAELRQEFVSDYTYSGQFDPEQEIEIRTISMHASTDKRDRRDFPTTGIYNKWIWESGNRLVLDADETFTKAMINLEGYYTLHSRSTWHLKLFAGYGDQTLPFSENFRLGGLHSFYGLAENAYYGRQLFLASAEYRYRLPVNLGKNNLLVNDMYVLARYDFAGIWDKPELLFSIDDFFSGIGGSLAFDTFLGPFYLGYGRTTRGEDHAYVSIGLNF